MRTLNAVDVAQSLVASTDATIIVLELSNAGGSMRWKQALPSLEFEQFSVLADGPAFLEFDSWLDAAAAFETIARDYAGNSEVGPIDGTVTLVCLPFGEDDGVETHTWTLGDSDVPVFSAAKGWTVETVFAA